MEAPSPLLARRKRRRRRRQDRPAISARLLLDERLKDDVGILSDDLWADLFPSQGGSGSEIRYVAVTPWMPVSAISSKTTTWSILPVKTATTKDPNGPHSSLQFPARSPTIYTFLESLQAVTPGKSPFRRDTPIEIRVLDTIPLGLDAVYVQLDTQALRQHEEMQAKFGGGFQNGPGANGVSRPNSLTQNFSKKISQPASGKVLESGWRKAVRDSLKMPKLVHAGGLLPLPLPAHPITHVQVPPARIVNCEPVSQGIVLPTTKIVILHSHKVPKTARSVVASSLTTPGIPEEDEDTSNEQFYSATEEKGLATGDDASEVSVDNLESEVDPEEDDHLSDDSEDAFSLSTSLLPPQAPGLMTSLTSATPRTTFGGFYTNGIATPGSTYSNFTATTAKSTAAGRGRVFKAQGLLQRLPEELLHPKPSNEDDEEARVYVETSTLVKLGCFSGDWIKLESASEPIGNGMLQWNLGTFGHGVEQDTDWRTARIYSMPESILRKGPQKHVSKTSGHQLNFLDLMRPKSVPTAYTSPVLLANLGDPSHLRITPFKHGGKTVSSTALPPHAKEVTLLKISTPLSTDRALQPSLFSSLKDYFEQRRRIVKTGDIIAIALDERLGRSVFQISTGDNANDDEIFAKSRSSNNKSGNRSANADTMGVAWFKIGNVITPKPEDIDDENIWGGMAFADAANTKMVQTGSEQAKIPATMGNSWQYYLGARRLPMKVGQNSGRELGAAEAPDSYISPLRRRLRELISASTSPQAIHLGLPPIAILITSTQRQIGKATVAEQACGDLGLHSFTIDGFDILTEGGSGGGDVKTEAFLKARADRAMTCGAQFTALLIKHIDALSADRIHTALREILEESRVLIATTTDIDKVPDGIRGLFTHELEMSAPDEKEREGILRGIVENSGIRIAQDVELSTVALKTAALVAGDLLDVIDRAQVAKANRLEALVDIAAKLTPGAADVSIRDIELAGGDAAVALTKGDFETAVDAARKNFADSIGAPKIPNVTWDDVGGLTHVKDAVMETIQLPLARPELFAKGMKKRSGILFYGPPGTGKTLLAKAIATEFSLNFFSVKGPELLNMYIGESEANVRRVFQRARDARPCVVFFDELDSVAPKRGNQGDSGGVMDRIVSQLLAELDGMSNGEEGGGGVFVIGATNRPDLLDQALLRPGRFDKMLYLGISDTHDKQLTILEALSRKFTLSPSLSLRRIADTLPFTYTGADLYALCSDAMLKAITRSAKLVDIKVAEHNAKLAPGSLPITVAGFFDHIATKEDTAVMVEEGDFIAAKNELVPSVSAEELGHYERVRHTFEGQGGEKKAIKGQSEGQRKSQARLTKGSQSGPPAAPSLRPSMSSGGTSSPPANGNGPPPMQTRNSHLLPLRPTSNPSVKDGMPSRARALSKLLRRKGEKGKSASTFYFDKNAPPSQDGEEAEPRPSQDDDEEDYVIRTDALNGSAHVNGNGSAASTNGSNMGPNRLRKASPSAHVSGFGNAAEGDEDMYAFDGHKRGK